MIRLQVERVLPARPHDAFALALDPVRFPAMFSGSGPVPGLRRITLHAPPAVGSTRELESSDGSMLIERITALESPRLHAYTLSGIRPPLGWLVRAGHARWTFLVQGDATRVEWRYEWEPSNALAWPLAWLLLHGFMQSAMARCLHAMGRELQSQVPPNGERG
ncbi:SRPBCC family protein [Lysobacter fragariae]